MGLSGKRLGKLPMPAEDVDPAVARAAADKMIPVLLATLQHSITLTSDLHKWILASLVTLNGGAIAITANAIDKFDDGQLSSAVLRFTVGSILAVLAALIGALSSIVTSGPLGEILGFWISVKETGEFDQTENARLSKKVQLWGLLSYLPAFLCGIGSLLAFALGVSALSI